MIELIDTSENRYILFCGHRGCGKSTELNNQVKTFHRPDGYFVVYCNIWKPYLFRQALMGNFPCLSGWHKNVFAKNGITY